MTRKERKMVKLDQQRKRKLLDDLIALNPDVPFDPDPYDGGTIGANYCMAYPEEVSEDVLNNIKLPEYCHKIGDVQFCSLHIRTDEGLEMYIGGKYF